MGAQAVPSYYNQSSGGFASSLFKQPRQSYYVPKGAAPLPRVGSFYSPPQAQQQPQQASSRVMAFHSPSKWKAYFESSKSTNKLMVIEFTAAWCGPCQKMEPAFEDIAASHTNVDFVKIDVDELMNAAKQFGVQAMPLFLFLKGGQQIDKVVGPKKEELQNKIHKHSGLCY